MTQKIIIDCDPGIDDALAIFLALADPDIQVLGLTTVMGNVALSQTYLNAQRILAVAKRLDIPVFKGAARPLLARADLFASVHGVDGLGDLGLSQPMAPNTPPTHAVQFILDQARAYPGEVTLCPIGPMTNVALALRMDPDLPRMLKGITFMGGAAFCPGNMNDHAEFNILVDPHAAEIVLQSGANLTMFGLDVTTQAQITPAHIAALATGGTCSRLAARLLQGYTAGDACLHDPCVTACLIDPTLFSGLRAQVSVTTHGPEFGRTVATPDPNGTCQVITQVDTERLFTLLTTRLAHLP